MKTSNFIFALIGFITLFSCQKKEQEGLSDIDKIKHNNKNSYPSIKMDSTQAMHSITQQKLQELLIFLQFMQQEIKTHK